MSITDTLSSLLLMLLAIALGAFVIWLAIVLVRYNRLRRHIKDAAQQATHDELCQVYELVEACGQEPHSGFMLARTNMAGEAGRNEIQIPDDISDFPWAGRTLAIHVDKNVTFSFADQSAGEIQLGGMKYLPVKIPRKKTKSGKLRNDFMPKIYLSKNPRLKPALEKLCPGYPEELLSYLLCAGSESFEFDSIDQARIGTSPSWVQNPEYQKCPQCRKSMSMILQLPGLLLRAKGLGAPTIFLFGCRGHPGNTAVVTQYT